MADACIACALEIPEPHAREALARRLRTEGDIPLLVLNTCQRLETFGRLPRAESPVTLIVREGRERETLRRLARIAAGLESRILGELEILGQVREAYKAFNTRHGQQEPRLDRLFQDALALARKARRESGIDQNLTGLSALAARKVMESVPEDVPVAIVGSGSLAQGVARYLGKRSRLPVRVASRCPENAMRLAMEVGGFAAGLDELAPLLCDARAIVTATAAPHALIYGHHLPATDFRRLIIDLGEPADCADEVKVRADIDYVGLLDMESVAQTNTDERRRRAALAAEIIDQAVAIHPGR